MSESQSSSDPPTESIEDEVRARFGVLPNFFRLAPDAPEITANLWQFAQFGYLDNPLPPLFKERLFVYLSRFCDVRYCIARHVGFLVGLGRPAGDELCPPETLERVVGLIRRPLPRGDDLEPHVAALEACADRLRELPESDTPLEEAIFACAAHVFLQTTAAARCLAVLRRLLHGAQFQHLLVFLTFVRTAHFWTKVHPELGYEDDVEQLLAVHEAVATSVLHDAEAAACDTAQVLMDELATLRQERSAWEAVRRREQQLRLVTDNAPVLIAHCDADRRYVFVNKAYADEFGREPADIVGRHLADILGPDAYARAAPHVDAVLVGQRVEYELDLPAHDRRPARLVRAAYEPERDPKGRVVGFVAAIADITDRKRVEEVLRERQAWLQGQREALEAALDGAPLELPLGVLVRTATDALGPDTRAAFHLSDDEGASLYHVVGLPAAYPDVVDGFARWSFPIHTSAGKFVGTLAVHPRPPREATQRDLELASMLAHTAAIIISRHKEAQARKLAEDALRESDRSKDEFLAILAHELRNPLAPIRSALHILRTAAPREPPGARVVEIMERQVDHMVRLVDDLLDVSRISRGSFELRKEPIEVAAIVRSAVETIQPLMEARGHRLALAIPSQQLTVEGDFVRLAQVVANLLNNAAKYSDEGGEIRLTVHREGDEVVISVHDTGRGIAADMLPRIFEAFVQGDGRPSRAPAGLGIGLTLVERLVQMHDGSVAAHSDGPGCGSEFVVRLPLRAVDRARPDREKAASVIADVPRQCVLVVDDNYDAAEMLGMLVETLGVDARVVHSGAVALDVLSTYRPSVVFLDIGMPDMDGYEVARTIRQRPEFRDVTLVALTGWGQEEDRRQSRAAGFDHHLVKPATLDALRNVLLSGRTSTAAGQR